MTSATMNATTSSAQVVPELHQIQKLVLQGYDFHRSRYLVLTVNQAALARQFLTRLGKDGWLTTAGHDRRWVSQRHSAHQSAVNFGLTFEGLLALGLTPRYQAVFKDKAHAFTQGAYLRAAARLADTGPNAAMFWDAAFQPRTAHVVLSLHADSLQALDASLDALKQLAGESFIPSSWANRFEGNHLEHTEPARKARRVHFGMLDGISPIRIKGISNTTTPSETPSAHEAGEFVLGYANDEGFNAWRLGTERPDTSEVPSQTQSEAIARFFKNASFGAFRPMAQNVLTFNHFVAHNAGRLNLTAQTVRAKLLGRWDDGQVVKPDGVVPALGLNNFDFTDDPQGLGCPFGAHIRRMNPRADPVVPFRRRLVCRRGIPYGPQLDEQSSPTSVATERGLLGLFFCASLEDQFEHLLLEWADANPMGVPNRGNANDPLIGNHLQPGSIYDIPTEGKGRQTLQGFTAFVRTVGTLYAFYPGVNGLESMDDPEVFQP